MRIKFTRAEIAALADAVDVQITALTGDALREPDAAEVLGLLRTLRDRLDHSLFETTANYQRVTLAADEAEELRVAAEVEFGKHRVPGSREESVLARHLERALHRIGPVVVFEDDD